MSKVLQVARIGRDEVGTGTGKDQQLLRFSAVAFIIAVAIHGADHVYRGAEILTSQVRSGGIFQMALGVVAVSLVFRRHRWAPQAALVVGFASAFFFSTAHLLPTWGSLSDSYLTPATGAGVTWFSWITALLEVAADLLFGFAGASALIHTPKTAPPA